MKGQIVHQKRKEKKGQREMRRGGGVGGVVVSWLRSQTNVLGDKVGVLCGPTQTWAPRDQVSHIWSLSHFILDSSQILVSPHRTANQFRTKAPPTPSHFTPKQNPLPLFATHNFQRILKKIGEDYFMIDSAFNPKSKEIPISNLQGFCFFYLIFE